MKANSLLTWSRPRLRVVMGLFFLALAVPSGILIYQAYSQLKWEAFHRHRVLAEELTARIDRRLAELIEMESARSFTDYSFLNVAGDPAAKLLQRSPLSAYPVTSSVAGVIGYFQIDNQGRFSTPLLPGGDPALPAYGISKPELQQRLKARKHIYEILSANRLLYKNELAQSKPGQTAQIHDQQNGQATVEGTANIAPTAESMQEEGMQVSSQIMFDKLNAEESTASPKAPSKGIGRVEDLKIEDWYQQKSGKSKQPAAITPHEGKKSKLRKEQNILPEQRINAGSGRQKGVQDRKPSPISIFESEVDTFEFSMLDSGHFVLYRKVWRDNQRYIQGLLIESNEFVRSLIDTAFYETALSQASSLAVAYHGNVLAVLSNKSDSGYLSNAGELEGTLLYQSRLSMPLSRMELIYSINTLPAGPGGQLIIWMAVILIIVLCGGFYSMYRLGLRQITLARQQQDFVSAVSHELKTPLTSIRMYGEMLREGWASEEKRKLYYDFIYYESERLTRLITNVLQLARMTRNELQVNLKTYSVAELLDNAQSKIASQVERAGFALHLDISSECRTQLLNVDADYFIQVVINLVDNALKFSAKAQTKQVDIQCRIAQDGRLQLCVRDYGPGIARDQMRKIFKLFYRSENALTRETVGTGIGLALSKQLLVAMHGEIDVLNQQPGAEFRILLPVTKIDST